MSYRKECNIDFHSHSSRLISGYTNFLVCLQPTTHCYAKAQVWHRNDISKGSCNTSLDNEIITHLACLERKPRATESNLWTGSLSCLSCYLRHAPLFSRISGDNAGRISKVTRPPLPGGHGTAQSVARPPLKYLGRTS